jgi:hypothetical protein
MIAHLVILFRKLRLKLLVLCQATSAPVKIKTKLAKRLCRKEPCKADPAEADSRYVPLAVTAPLLT